MEQQEARELSSLYLDFVAWWNETAHARARKQLGPYRAPGANKKNLAALREMIAWCRDRNVDPRVWLYLLFSVRAWRAAPQFAASHLQNPKWLEAYAKRKKSIPQAPIFRARLLFAQTTLATAAFDPRLHIDAIAEARKGMHRLNTAQTQCMAEMDEQTYGWHPESLHCQACPVAQTCRDLLDERIGYPLSQVREGKKTLQELNQ